MQSLQITSSFFFVWLVGVLLLLLWVFLCFVVVVSFVVVVVGFFCFFFFLVVCWFVTVVSPFTLGTRNEEVGSDEDDIARKRWERGKISNLIFFF